MKNSISNFNLKRYLNLKLYMDPIEHADLLYGSEWPLLEVKSWPSPQLPSAKRAKLDTSDNTQSNIQSKINCNNRY